MNNLIYLKNKCNFKKIRFSFQLYSGQDGTGNESDSGAEY